MGKRVILGLSGGMDSAYTAIKLLELGYDVTAVYILMCDACNSSAEAAALASALGVSFEVLDAREEFERLVVAPFARAYVNGITPNPCVLCNPSVKLKKLYDFMVSNGADYIATGHYSVPVNRGQRWSFGMAADVSKDQGYFLYAVEQEIIGRTLMPLGKVLKSDIKAYFDADNGGVKPPKTESTDICFVSGKSYVDIISKRFALPPAGDYVDENGKPLGKHKGIHNYTIGQRKGLGIALGRPAYVSAIDAASNTVTLSVGDACCSGFNVENVSYLSVPSVSAGDRYTVRVRYRARPVNCVVTAVTEKGVSVSFDAPQPPVAKGQSAVFYDGEGVIAFGGVIA